MEMISNKIEATLVDSQHRSAFSAEQEESTGCSLSFDVLLLNKSKMVNILRNMCLHLTEEEYDMMNLREEAVEDEGFGSF